MIVKNPYLDAKRDILKQMFDERDPIKLKVLKAKYDDVERQLTEYNQRILEKLKDKKDDRLERKEYVKEELKINIRQQYRQAIDLYRNVNELLIEIRHLKKEIRENLELDKQKRQMKLSEV